MPSTEADIESLWEEVAALQKTVRKLVQDNEALQKKVQGLASNKTSTDRVYGVRPIIMNDTSPGLAGAVTVMPSPDDLMNDPKRW